MNAASLLLADSDDAAIVGGLGRIDGRSVVVIGHEKGRDTKSKIRRNFGMPRPEGYRKALRLMKMAERFGIPLLTFIDTPGAYPGVIAVAATRPDDSAAPFSTNGDFVDIAAPGDAVLSTWDSRLDNTAATPAALQPTHGIGYKVDAGTSMSAPIVAGLAALGAISLGAKWP